MAARSYGSGVPTATGVKPRVCRAGGCTVSVYPWTRKRYDHFAASAYLADGNAEAHAYEDECGVTADVEPAGLEELSWLGKVRVVVDPARGCADVSALTHGEWFVLATLTADKPAGPAGAQEMDAWAAEAQTQEVGQ